MVFPQMAFAFEDEVKIEVQIVGILAKVQKQVSDAIVVIAHQRLQNASRRQATLVMQAITLDFFEVSAFLIQISINSFSCSSPISIVMQTAPSWLQPLRRRSVCQHLYQSTSEDRVSG